DPLEPRLIERELLLLAVSRPIADEDTVGELTDDVQRPIGGVGVDDDDFVAPLHAFEAGADVVLLVIAHDDRGSLRAPWLHRRLDCPRVPGGCQPAAGHIDGLARKRFNFILSCVTSCGPRGRAGSGSPRRSAASRREFYGGFSTSSWSRRLL